MPGPVLGTYFLKGNLAMIVPLLETLEVRLFTNDHEPTKDDDATDYTEPDAPWYSPIPLLAWSSVVLDDQGIPAVYHNPLSFDNPTGSPVDVYGYFVVDSNGAFCWAERDAAPPVSFDVGTEPYVVSIRYTLKQDVGV